MSNIVVSEFVTPDGVGPGPSYVVSTTLTRPEWSNTVIINGNAPERVRQLKQQLDGDILVAGSAQLIPTLIEHDLIDEYRLMIFPTVLGAGRLLFSQGGPATDLRIAEARQMGDAVLVIAHPAAKARL